MGAPLRIDGQVIITALPLCLAVLLFFWLGHVRLLRALLDKQEEKQKRVANYIANPPGEQGRKGAKEGE
jgi:hypothetical protein